jgi:hypothetical protein
VYIFFFSCVRVCTDRDRDSGLIVLRIRFIYELFSYPTNEKPNNKGIGLSPDQTMLLGGEDVITTANTSNTTRGSIFPDR